MGGKSKTPKRPVKPPARPVTIDDVRAAALALPATEERPSYGTPGFRVKDKLFARVIDDAAIVVTVDFDQRDMLLDSRPDVFSVTPHYQGYPMVIVSLAAVDDELLRDILVEAWREVAPAAVRARLVDVPPVRKG